METSGNPPALQDLILSLGNLPLDHAQKGDLEVTRQRHAAARLVIDAMQSHCAESAAPGLIINRLANGVGRKAESVRACGESVIVIAMTAAAIHGLTTGERLDDVKTGALIHSLAAFAGVPLDSEALSGNSESLPLATSRPKRRFCFPRGAFVNFGVTLN